MSRDRRIRWQARLEGEALPALETPLPPPINARPGRVPLPPAGVRTPDAAAHHWIFTGPRNVGGRVRALALHPAIDGVFYAGTASGGVFKTDDNGETWRPLWHQERSLSIAAIAIAPQDPRLIYVATGEPPGIPGAGIYRSTDDGAHWQPIATVATLNQSVRLEQIAVHPGSAPGMKGLVYAVGPRGVFRSTNADASDPATVVFQRLSEGAGEDPDDPIAYSDAAFGASEADATRFFLYLCRAKRVGGEIIRIEQPDAPHASVEAALRDASNRRAVLPLDTVPLPAGSPQWLEPETERGRFTLCRDHANVMYAAFARNAQDHRNAGYRTPLRAIVRCRNANRAASFSGTAWTEIPYRPTPGLNDFRAEDFGWWMLMISVHPSNPDLVFFAMVRLYVCRNANSAAPEWNPAMPAELWRLDKAFHPDNHAVVFDRLGEAWLACDGGVAVTANLASWLSDPARTDYLSEDAIPEELTRALLPANPLRWRRRIHGLVAVQAYDVTQNPLVPTMYGCGMQDVGVWYTAGGGTWRWALDGDGGFIAFDPDDPYRTVMTWQGAVHSSAFAGAVERAVPAPDVFFGGFDFALPRSLSDGFLRIDSARFTGDTSYHGRKINRIVTLRENRAYATTNGERFSAFDAGAYPELVITFRHRQVDYPDPVGSQFHHNGMVLVQVVDTPGARKLGFLPGTRMTTRNVTPNPFRISALPNPTAPAEPFATNVIRVRGLTPELFALAANDTLEIVLRCRDRGGTERDFTARVVFTENPLIPDLAHATAAQVAAFIRAQVAVSGPVPVLANFQLEVAAWPAFGAAPAAIELMTASRTDGAVVAALEIGGTSGVPEAFGLSPGRYVGAPGWPASVTLALARMPKRSREPVGVTSGATLTVAVDGGAPVTVTFDRSSFNDLAAIRSGELAAALNAQLGARAIAIPNMVQKAFVIRRRDPGQTATVVATGSTALAELTSGNTPPGRATAVDRPSPEPELTFYPGTRWNAFDLREVSPGTPRRLIVRGASGPGDVTIDFDAGGFVDRQRATIEEVVAKVTARLAAVPTANLRCDLIFSPSLGEPTEAAYDPGQPDALWIGGMDGTIWRSADDGRTWRRIQVPRFARQMRAIEAIAVHPADSRIVFVGLASADNDSSNTVGRDPAELGDEGDDGTLYVTESGGGRWRALGRDTFTVLEDPADPASRVRPIGVVEVVIDPASTALATTRLWVATLLGVFESRDGGQTFLPITEGLPNVRVIDLAYEPMHQLLRCATFGRGTYARYVGSGAASPAPLYLRMSLLDDGTGRPADDGYDGFAAMPQQARRWESPDIKASALPWTSTSTTLPELGPTPAQIDGAELDDEVEHQPFGAGAGPVNVFVQVHSRSAVAIGDARVIVLWADGGDGPPPLELAFWAPANLAAATPTLPAGSAWHLVGAADIAPAVSADRPCVVRLAFDPPAELGSLRDVGLLAIVTSTASATAATTDDVVRLLDSEPRVAYRATRTRVVREARSILLAHERAGTFSVAETPLPGALGFAGASAQAARSNAAATFDVRPVGTTPRRLSVTVGLDTAAINLRPADFVDPSAATPAELRRVLARELRLARLPVRCQIGEVALSVRGPDRAAALVAAAAAPATPLDAMVLGRWQRSGTLSRATAQHIHLRIANDGDAPETAILWRVYAVDPSATPVVLAAGNLVGSGTLPALAPGAAGAVEVDATYLPAVPASATRHALVAVSHSDGDPLRAPFSQPPATELSFPSLAELDAYCASHPSVAYRVFEVIA